MAEALTNERQDDCLAECTVKKTYLYQLTHTELLGLFNTENLEQLRESNVVCMEQLAKEKRWVFLRRCKDLNCWETEI